MAPNARFRIQTGGLVLEIEGSEKFVLDGLTQHRSRIDTMLREQAALIRDGNIPPAAVNGKRGRPTKKKAASITRKGLGKPGRQPVIIRTSDLKIPPKKLDRLKHYILSVAGDRGLGKDGIVFAIAWFLCKHVLETGDFTAGDVTRAHKQLGRLTCAPAAASVDVVQMLRNLSASSIGKEWVGRNGNGSFCLTAKGRKVGQTGNINRPRGRKPMKKKSGK